ncbi:MAG: hypothetical protein ACLT76_03890 [Clostridium fessum]
MSEDKKLNMPQSLLLLLLIIGAVAVCIRLKDGRTDDWTIYELDHHLSVL